MRVIKKNQIIVVLISFCLIIVGYLNYTNQQGEQTNTIVGDIRNYTEGMGDAQLVSSNSVESSEENTIISEETQIENTVEETSIENVEEVEQDYFTESKLERNNIYSQTIEVYENMLENSSITNEQKAIAQNEIQKITTIKNSILISENLIKIKGFEDVVVFENGGNVSVIVKADILQPEQVAQIQNIISREFNIETGNINITNK